MKNTVVATYDYYTLEQARKILCMARGKSGKDARK